MKSGVLSFLFILIFCSLGYGQSDYQDVVYLKNGSVIRGTIIEQIPGDSLRIETYDGRKFVIYFEVIKKIAKKWEEQDLSEQELTDEQDMIDSNIRNDKTRFINFTGINFSSSADGSTFGIKMINGGLINNFMSVGFGFGYEKYPNGHMIPLFIDQRLFGDIQKSGPYIFADIGYSLGSISDLDESSTEDFDDGGFLFDVGIGLILISQSNMGLTFDIAFKHQIAKEYQIYRIDNTHDIIGWKEVSYKFFCVGVGLSF